MLSQQLIEDMQSIIDQRFVPRRYDAEDMNQRQKARQDLIKRQKAAREKRQEVTKEHINNV